MSPPVMRDDAIALPPEVQHLPVPVVPAQRPAVAENDWLSFAPVLVINLCSVFCGDGCHKRSPCIQCGYAAGRRGCTSGLIDAHVQRMATIRFQLRRKVPRRASPCTQASRTAFRGRHLARIKKCKTLREDYTCPNCALCMIDALSRLGRSHHETSARLCLCVFLAVFAVAMPLSRTSQARRRKTR